MPLLNVTKKNTVKLSFPTFYGQCAPCTCRFFLPCSPICQKQIYTTVSQPAIPVCLAVWQNCCTPESALLISEHGIYTREREEEIIKASWIRGLYKNLWIEQFAKMSLFAYQTADKVTSLFEHARTLQIELGCPEEKRL